MERLPIGESAPSKERVIELLKEQGGNPEAIEAFRAWMDNEMELLAKLPKGDGSFERAQIALNAEVALVVLAGGLLEEAHDQLHAAWIHAKQAGTIKMTEELWAKIVEVERILNDGERK